MRLVINSLGKTADRIKYREALISYLEPFADELSEDSKKSSSQKSITCVR